MKLVVVNGTKRNGELVADFEAQASILSITDVVRLCRLAPADEAGVRRYGLEVLTASMPFDRGNRQLRLVDPHLNVERNRGRALGAIQLRLFEFADRDNEIGVVQTSPIAQIGMNALEPLKFGFGVRQLSIDVQNA